MIYDCETTSGEQRSSRAARNEGADPTARSLGETRKDRFLIGLASSFLAASPLTTRGSRSCSLDYIQGKIRDCS